MWIVNEGWEPLPGIGPGPIEDDAFEVAAAAYGAMHACTVEDVKAGPVYRHVSAAQQRRDAADARAAAAGIEDAEDEPAVADLEAKE